MQTRPLSGPLFWLLVLTGTPLLGSLAYWQWSRAQQKILLLEQKEKAQQESPLSTSTLLEAPFSLKYRRVRLTGTPQNTYSVLLDNQISHGQPGYFVLTPFALTPHLWILVNRGWIPQGPSRRTLPPLSPLPETEFLRGTLSNFPYRPFVHPPSDTPLGHWPLRIQQLDGAFLSQQFGKSLYPLWVVLDTDAPGAFEMPIRPPMMAPLQHQSYALQWLLFAAIWLGGLCWYRYKH